MVIVPKNSHSASITGRHVNFDGINAYPRPVQKPYPPIVVGGRSEGANRRTVRYAAGWYGYAMTLDQTREQLAALAAARRSEADVAEKNLRAWIGNA